MSTSICRLANGKVVHGLFRCWVQADLNAEQVDRLYPHKLGRSAVVGGRHSNDGGTSFHVMASNERGICEDDVRGAVAALLHRTLGWPEPERHDSRIFVELIMGYNETASGHTTGSPRTGMTVQSSRAKPPTTSIAASG
jgi:hypothetical protein